MKNTIEKYLLKYAEPQTTELISYPFHHKHVLVIPAFNESADILAPYLKNTFNDLLIIFVVNRPDQCKSKEAIRNTTKLINTISNTYACLWKSPKKSLSVYKISQANHLLLIDLTSPNNLIPAKKGVGLARKIGCDVAASLIHNQHVSHPCIFSTDADALLSKNHFSAIPASNSPKTYIYRLSHLHDRQSKHYLSGLLYDFHLHYYEFSLANAGSPYAYQTIGSLLAFHYALYCQVRGFPQRAAGEDFYLLNKLKKVGNIQKLGTPVTVSMRLSERVPFGTGQAVKHIHDLLSPMDEFHFYHPTCFERLKQLLSQLDTLRHWILNSTTTLNVQPEVISALNAIGFLEQVQHFRKHGTTTQSFKNQFHQWFDGFKTLKFIHELRKRYLSVHYNIARDFIHQNQVSEEHSKLNEDITKLIHLIDNER